MQEGFLKENTEWALADLLIVQVALVFWFTVCLLTTKCYFRCGWL